MVDAIVHDKNRVVPVSVLLEGEYGINGLYFGVPVKLGAGGIKEIIEVSLTDDEQAALIKSSQAVKGLVDAMANL